MKSLGLPPDPPGREENPQQSSSPQVQLHYSSVLRNGADIAEHYGKDLLSPHTLFAHADEHWSSEHLKRAVALSQATAGMSEEQKLQYQGRFLDRAVNDWAGLDKIDKALAISILQEQYEGIQQDERRLNDARHQLYEYPEKNRVYHPKDYGAAPTYASRVVALEAVAKAASDAKGQPRTPVDPHAFSPPLDTPMTDPKPKEAAKDKPATPGML